MIRSFKHRGLKRLYLSTPPPCRKLSTFHGIAFTRSKAI
jgi:hypothetical protein